MAFFEKNQALVFLIFLVLGIVVAILKSIVKKLTKTKNNALKQVVYSFLVILAYFCFYYLVLILNFGVMRFFMVVAVICGFLLYGKGCLLLRKVFKIKRRSKSSKICQN